MPIDGLAFSAPPISAAILAADDVALQRRQWPEPMKRLPLGDLLVNRIESSQMFFDKTRKVFAAAPAGAENEIENFGVSLF